MIQGQNIYIFILSQPNKFVETILLYCQFHDKIALIKLYILVYLLGKQININTDEKVKFVNFVCLKNKQLFARFNLALFE